MKTSKFSEERIACAWRQAESYTEVADVCRRAFPVQYETFATLRQSAALLSELARNDMVAAFGALQRLTEQQDALQPYIFFAGVKPT